MLNALAVTTTLLAFAPPADVATSVASDPVVVDAWQSTLQTVVLAVIGLLGNVITGLITVGSGKIMKWLDAKSKASGSEAHYAAFKCATEKLSTWSRSAVDEVEQTVVRKLKRENKWDKGTARMARDTAVEVMTRHAGEHGMAELQDCLGVGKDVVLGMFRTWIEKQVRDDGSSGNGSPIVAMGDDAEGDLDGHVDDATAGE